jgi:tetratricopeptide (TPR) repeat protein
MRAMRTVAAIVVAAVALSACGKDTSPTRSDLAHKYTLQAWNLFTAGDYEGALLKFEEALDELSEYVPALTGRAWSLCFLGDFAEARYDFVLANELSATHEADIWAGGAFCYAALEDYDKVVEWGESAIGVDVTWVFDYNNSIDVRHVRYVLATAYWYRGSYNQCKTQLDILEPGSVHDVDPQALLADLQRLYISPFD